MLLMRSLSTQSISWPSVWIVNTHWRKQDLQLTWGKRRIWELPSIGDEQIMRFWGHCGLQTASEVWSDLRFEIYGPNYICYIFLGWFDPFWIKWQKEERKKERTFTSTRVVGFAATKTWPRQAKGPTYCLQSRLLVCTEPSPRADSKHIFLMRETAVNQGLVLNCMSYGILREMAPLNLTTY